jgi:hypothetical protein
LFAFAGEEPPQLSPERGSPGRAPNVTVSYQQGMSAHLGALPAERATLLGHEPEPATRVVSRSGAAGSGPASAALAVPHYRSLTDALVAIDGDPARAPVEVIEIADSATYRGEAPAWPGTGGGGAGSHTLIVRAAEEARPVVLATDWTAAAGAAFARVLLRGLTLGAVAPAAAAVPIAPPLIDPPVDLDLDRAELELTLCSIATAVDPVLGTQDVAVRVTAPAGGARVRIRRSIAGPLERVRRGELEVLGSIVDPGDPAALAVTAPEGEVVVERSTVLGATEVDVLEASESIFVGVAVVLDRFHGCIRFSNVALGSVLPRRHEVVPDLDLPAPVAVVPRFVSRDRTDAAFARLAERCDRRIQFGAVDGAEMGAFHDELWSVRREALLRRLTEFTPAGLVTGLIRMD